MTHCFFLRHSFPSITLAASVTAVLYMVIMVLMSMSSSLSLTSGANFPPMVARKLQATSGSLNFSRSNLSLGWFGFHVFKQTRKFIITRPWSLPMSAPAKLLVPWMLTPDWKLFLTASLWSFGRSEYNGDNKTCCRDRIAPLTAPCPSHKKL